MGSTRNSYLGCTYRDFNSDCKGQHTGLGACRPPYAQADDDAAETQAETQADCQDQSQAHAQAQKQAQACA